MNTRRAFSAALGVILACSAMVLPALAQMPNQVLPGSYTAAMVTGFPYIAAPAFFPAPSYSGSVSYHIDKVGNTYTYFYKIEHFSGDSIRMVSLNIPPMVVDFDAGLNLYKFGAFKPGAASSILVADPIIAPGTAPIRWSSANPMINLFQDTTYLWVQSFYPGYQANMAVIDGIASNTTVPAPAPEPMSMALASIGLTAVAAIRRIKR